MNNDLVMRRSTDSEFLLHYTAMGYASYLVWNNGGGSLPLTLYGVQLVLNLAWSPIFFKKREIGFALLDITGEAGLCKPHHPLQVHSLECMPYGNQFQNSQTFQIVKSRGSRCLINTVTRRV